jgi:hypothetical protein
MLMKKLLLAGLVALVVLLAFPTAVSAANTVSVSGLVPVTISIDVAPTSFDFGTMTAVNAAGPSTVSVTTSSVNWRVDAESWGGSTAGYMFNSSRAKTLGAAFNMSNIALSGPYNQTTTLWSGFMSGGAAGYYSSPVYVQQLVSPVDTEGAYSIVATFTTWTA